VEFDPAGTDDRPVAHNVRKIPTVIAIQTSGGEPNGNRLTPYVTPPKPEEPKP
jgi:hypothetical protein